MKSKSRKNSAASGIIDIDLFSVEVDSEDNPEAAQFREMLEEAAGDYGCQLVIFEVTKGTVSFSFDDDVLTAKILTMLRERPPE